MNILTILDISNKHKRQYVAFGTTVINGQHIIAGDTLNRLYSFFEAHNYLYEDFCIFNREGKLVEAYKLNKKCTALNCDKIPLFIKVI